MAKVSVATGVRVSEAHVTAFGACPEPCNARFMELYRLLDVKQACVCLCVCVCVCVCVCASLCRSSPPRTVSSCSSTRRVCAHTTRSQASRLSSPVSGASWHREAAVWQVTSLDRPQDPIQGEPSPCPRHVAMVAPSLVRACLTLNHNHTQLDKPSRVCGCAIQDRYVRKREDEVRVCVYVCVCVCVSR